MASCGPSPGRAADTDPEGILALNQYVPDAQ
jgi:hypothetical protein